MSRKVRIQRHALDNGIDDYQVVVKPHPGIEKAFINRFGIVGKANAEEYARELGERFNCPVVDEAA